MLFAPVVHHFVEMMGYLDGYIESIDWEKIEHAPDGYFKEESRAELWGQVIDTLVEPCKSIDIDISAHAARAKAILKGKSTDQIQNLKSRFEDIRFKIEDELKKRCFLYIPAGQDTYYDHSSLFGEQVSTSFPEANNEIREAGKCYAVGSNTACVFHLMRAVEHGARVMVTELKVKKRLARPVELCDWNNLITAMESGLNAAAKGRRQSIKAAERSEFFNHAVAQFRNFKDAWRNNVAHTRKIYQPGETKDIIDNTRQFMQHLATRLKE